MMGNCVDSTAMGTRRLRVLRVIPGAIDEAEAVVPVDAADRLDLLEASLERLSSL